MRGAAHTHALLDDRVPPTSADGPDPARLLHRYLAGHGPASVRDFARWSSLTLGATRAALARLAEELGDSLAFLEVDGETFAHLPGEDLGTAPRVLLLPLYDELPLAYRDLPIPTAPDHPHPPGVDIFVGSVLADGVNVGTWRREVRGSSVEVAIRLAGGTPDDVQTLAHAQAVRLAAFLGRALERR